MRTRSSLFPLLALVVLTSASESSVARPFTNSIAVRVRVVDQNDHPVVGASIWYMANNREDDEITHDVMERLVRRYHNDVDYVQDVNLHPMLLVDYTDTRGEVAIEWDKGDIHNRKHLQVYLAALKHGFIPTMYDLDARTNKKYNVALKISGDPSVRIDSRLEKLDQLRAMVSGPRKLGKGSAAILQNVREQLQDLAMNFEQAGLKDEASVVYFYMAYLPSIDVVTDGRGVEIVQGHTSGFTRSDPKRRADMIKARLLNQSNPQIRYDRIYWEFEGAGVLVMGEKSKSADRKRYIAETEQFLRETGERAWPGTFGGLWQADEIEYGYPKACETIQAFYRFEPSYYSVKGWWGLIESLESGMKLNRSQHFDCKIPGLRSQS